MVNVQYSITEEDQIAFSVMHHYGNVPRFLMIVGGIIIALIAVAFFLDDWMASLSVLIGGIVGMTIMLAITRFIVVPRFARRAYRDFALIREPFDLTLREDGFSIVQPSAHVDSPWANMLAWDENSQVFAIYITDQQAYILPKDDIGPQAIDYARAQLIESGLIKRGKRRK